MSSPRPILSDSSWAVVDEQAAKSGFRSTDEYLQALLAEARAREAIAESEALRSEDMRSDEHTRSNLASSSDSTPEDLLQRLGSDDLSAAEQRRLIIEAEVLRFDGALRPQLNAALHAFIERRRDSDDPMDLVAVASAIRKLVANLSPEDLALAATLLDAGHRAVPPLEVELEVAKALVRKLAAHPAANRRLPSNLVDGLMDLARTYLHDRLLAREKHGAVALNTALALLLYGGEHGREVIARLKGLRQTWFTELVARRAARLREQQLRRSEIEADTQSLGLLDEVVELFASPQPPQGSLHAGAAS